MMGRHYLAGLLLAASILSGCAVVQKPIPATSAIFEQKESTVVVAIEKMPEPGQVMLGSQGLLDIVINRANAKAIVDRLQTQDFSQVSGLPQSFRSGLESRQIKVVMIDAALDTETMPKFTEGSGEGIALRDYRPLAKQYKADKLLLITPRSLGTVRSYYGFMPLGAPMGYIALTGQLVNLSTNKLEWYDRVEVQTAALGEWDQAPEYDNLMKAVDESTRGAVGRLRGSFFMEKASPTAAPLAGGSAPATAVSTQ
ncbi:hypothetical protein [Cupriavidus agavae]|uniref:Lipoprotein n=1 Tax=Cupriavidus agavae TaxID=1001822 RepID=A0A4Q7RT88_9BURK|nr:hypothetical protein [Cupriavidus agavae]RZT36861.1 hypothetical protein EV147_3525 [Cupriavidus agavae]